MFLRGALVSLAIVGTLSGVAMAHPQAQSSNTAAACFADNTVTQVVPQRAAVMAGQGSYERLAGARAFVPARPGLTGEWLHAQLARRSSAPQQGTSCPLDVPGINISVSSAGPGFWVSLTTPDQDHAKEVLRRAQTLAR